MIELPVQSVLPQVADALLGRGCAVLTAAPGAGKTTLVPPYLLEHCAGSGKKILMLEPRRLAARSSARRIASLMGEPVGKTVGYRTRFDSKVSPSTRIEVLTEGILTRMIQRDPELTGVDTVIFDEFHERSIHADLALALVLDMRTALRPDLKVLVMSATMDSAGVSRLLDNAPVIESPGKMFPVRTVHVRRNDPSLPIEPDIAVTIRSALRSDEGDILVFLPGEGEIRRTAALLKDLPDGIGVYPLYGNLPKEQQDAAVDPDPEGRRKVILSTSIAETSLTIENVRIVVDCGLMRVSRFSPGSGMNRLETVRVSRASADQRRGRAGRTSPGVCYRLWSMDEQNRLPEFNVPEILDSDLAPLLLELAAWGVRPESADSMKWMDAPPRPRLIQAENLLKELHALDPSGAISEHGKEILALPMHPRLAHAVLKAKKYGWGYTACAIAALLSDRDPVRGGGADLRIRLALFRGNGNADPGAMRSLRDAASQCAHAAGVDDMRIEPERAGVILSFAYPDRIAYARSANSGEYLLSGGTGAVLRREDPLSGNVFLAAASVEGPAEKHLIHTAAPLTREDLERYSPELFSEDFAVRWNSERKALDAEKRVLIGKMVIETRAAANQVSGEKMLAAYLNGIRMEGIRAIPFEKKQEHLRERVEFLRKLMPDDFPDMSDPGLMDSLEIWLAPFADGFTRLDQLKKIDLQCALESLLTHRQKQELARMAPERIEVPSGSRIRIDYSSPDGKPFMAVKLQEMFGLLDTPRVAGGRIPVTIQMLSPAMRPVQTTSDLRHFWTESYFLVRKDLRGRYPKHDWPENPLEAKPSSRRKH